MLFPIQIQTAADVLTSVFLWEMAFRKHKSIIKIEQFHCCKLTFHWIKLNFWLPKLEISKDVENADGYFFFISDKTAEYLEVKLKKILSWTEMGKTFFCVILDFYGPVKMLRMLMDTYGFNREMSFLLEENFLLEVQNLKMSFLWCESENILPNWNQKWTETV